MSGGARTCSSGHGRMDQYVAHDHEPADIADQRDCHAVWKCLTCFHQISRQVDCRMEVFGPGERVRGMFDLATVRELLPDGGVLVEWDQVDSAGWWRTGSRLTMRTPWSLTRVAADTPMAEENAESKRYRAERPWA